MRSSKDVTVNITFTQAFFVMCIIFAQVKHPKACDGSKYNRTNTDSSLMRLRLFTSELFKPPISLYLITPGCSCSLLGTQTYGVELGLFDPVSV